MPDETPDPINTAGKVGRNGRWRRVERARARLEGNANKIMQAMINKALAGDVKAGKWLLEHTAATDDQGNELRPLARGVDTPTGNVQPGDTGPRIVIGVSLGSDFARLNTYPTDRPALQPAVVSLPVSHVAHTSGKPND